MDFRTDILIHRDRLYRLALGITLHTAEAEDVVQDTMLRAWERREEWPQIQNMEAWLTQICRNLALDRRKRTLFEVNAEPEVTPVTDHTLETREAMTLLSNLMTLLPPPQDDIVRLRDIEGLSYRDIATKLELSENQVRVYLHRARQKLRQQYMEIQDFGL